MSWQLKDGVEQGSPASEPWTGIPCEISGNIRLEIKYIINVMALNHHETTPAAPSVEKLSSMNLAPGAKKAGDQRVDSLAPEELILRLVHWTEWPRESPLRLMFFQVLSA